MGIIRCSLIECIRKPVKYIILFLIFTIIFTGVLIGLNSRSTANAAKDRALDTIGAYLLYELKDTIVDKQQYISNDVKTAILSVEHVKGINQNISEYAIPVDFENVKTFLGVTPDPNVKTYEEYVDLTPNSVIMEANLDCELIDDFRLDNSSLIEGEFPSLQHPGVVIEQRLAEKNNLTIGDTMSFTSLNDVEVEATIVGIYKTAATFTITENNELGEAIFAMSPYNKIYASLDIGAAIYKKNIESLSLYIYVDQPQNVQTVGKAIKKLDLDWDDYGLFNMTATKYSMKGGQIESLSNYSQIILFYVIAMGAVFLSLVLTIYVQYYTYDAGIFLAIGASKKRILIQYFIIMSMIIVLSMIASIICSIEITNQITSFLIKQTTRQNTIISSYTSGIEASYEIHSQVLALRDYLYFAGIAILFLLFSCIPLVNKIVKYQPRRILTSERG